MGMLEAMLGEALNCDESLVFRHAAYIGSRLTLLSIETQPLLQRPQGEKAGKPAQSG